MTRAGRVVVGLAAMSSLAVVLAACAASPAKSSTAPPAAAPDGAAAGAADGSLAPTPRSQIIELDAQISAAREQLGLTEPTDDMLQGVPAQPLGALPATDDPKCRPAPTDTCKTSCTLGDSICKNADSICRIAQDLGADTWAQNKCAKANQTCEASRAKCCGCQA